MNDSKDVSIHMLLIEPDPDTRDIISRALTLNFPTIRLDAADNTENALTLVRQKSYHAIICDALLLRADKVSFVNEVCAEKPGVPLLIITAHTDINLSDFKEFPDSRCFHAILYKPITLKDLMQEVRGAIGKIAERRAVER